MRIVLSVEDLAFFDRVPETLHFTLEPATDCDGDACHGPGALQITRSASARQADRARSRRESPAVREIEG
jgi:hypothetical protein